MNAFLLAVALLAAPETEEPLRWLPVVFERAAWVPAQRPTLLTDLGRFTWDGGRWNSRSSAIDPIVPLNRVKAAAPLGEELVLAPNRASALLTEGGRRVIVLRPEVARPISLDWQGEGPPPTSLRLLGEAEGSWFLQGVTVEGDATIGVFLLRLEKAGAGAAWVHPFPKETMPAFVSVVRAGDETWLTPDRSSDSQTLWVQNANTWRRESPPTERSSLLDVMAQGDVLWFAYSDGVGIAIGGIRKWYAVSADLTAPGWLCLATGGSRDIQGRWMRGERIVGWGVGISEPSAEYPLDGASCDFYTNASATQGLVTPPSVKISLTTAGDFPVAPK